jgi:hypothetical protein
MKKMKLGRTAWLVLGVGAFVIVFATLFVVYSRQSGEQGELERSLTGAQTQLTKLISGREAIASQLTERQSELAAAQALLSSARGSFPRVEASIEYDEVLAEIAADYNLEVVSMSAEEPREQKIEDVTFIVLTFEAKVRGEVSSMLNMLDDIATDERFASATVEVVDIKVPEASEGGEVEEPTATIELVGYSYGGE